MAHLGTARAAKAARQSGRVAGSVAEVAVDPATGAVRSLLLGSLEMSDTACRTATAGAEPVPGTPGAAVWPLQAVRPLKAAAGAVYGGSGAGALSGVSAGPAAVAGCTAASDVVSAVGRAAGATTGLSARCTVVTVGTGPQSAADGVGPTAVAVPAGRDPQAVAGEVAPASQMGVVRS